MKLVKTASGKQTIKISKKEWQSIGKKAGWMKTAKCDSCQMVSVNGTPTHEIGCPNSWKSEKRECKWCGEDFKPKDKNQKCCGKSCEKSYNS